MLAPRATRTPLDFIQALNSSAVMRLPFWFMSNRHGVLSNSVLGWYAAGSVDDGVVVADGSTYDVLTDDALMRAHRLELPFGFDPTTIANLP